MKLRITKRIAEELTGIATIEDDDGPTIPTLYKMWKDHQLRFGSELDMPREDWIAAIGTLMFEGANAKSIRFLLKQVNDGSFERECSVAAGLLPVDDGDDRSRE